MLPDILALLRRANSHPPSTTSPLHKHTHTPPSDRAPALQTSCYTRLCKGARASTSTSCFARPTKNKSARRRRGKETLGVRSPRLSTPTRCTTPATSAWIPAARPRGRKSEHMQLPAITSYGYRSPPESNIHIDAQHCACCAWGAQAFARSRCMSARTGSAASASAGVVLTRLISRSPVPGAGLPRCTRQPMSMHDASAIMSAPVGKGDAQRRVARQRPPKEARARHVTSHSVATPRMRAQARTHRGGRGCTRGAPWRAARPPWRRRRRAA